MVHITGAVGLRIQVEGPSVVLWFSSGHELVPVGFNHPLSFKCSAQGEPYV